MIFLFTFFLLPNIFYPRKFPTPIRTTPNQIPPPNPCPPHPHPINPQLNPCLKDFHKKYKKPNTDKQRNILIIYKQQLTNSYIFIYLNKILLFIFMYYLCILFIVCLYYLLFLDLLYFILYCIVFYILMLYV